MKILLSKILQKLTELKNKDKVQYNCLYQKVISVGEFKIL
jgi:hypothetical protein